MPLGTYQPGRKVRIEAEEEAGLVRFFDQESDELLQTHTLSLGVGKLVRTSHADRPRHQKLIELRRQVLQGFGDTELSERFVEGILQRKPRYAKDQMSWLIRLQRLSTPEELDTASLTAWSAAVRRVDSDTLNTSNPSLNHSAYARDAALKYSLVVASQRPIQPTPVC
jgi:hypothetical protein